MILAASEHQDDQLLNAAITRANIKESFEPYLEIVDAFYIDNVEVILGEDTEPLRGRDELRARLAIFLAPIHVMAKLGGLSVSIRSTGIPGSDGDGTHSRWEATFRASSGMTRAFGWSVQRRWRDSRVTHERHYDHQVDGH